MKRKNRRKEAPAWIRQARSHWKYTGNERPPFAVEPKKGQRSVWDFPRPPVIEKVNKYVTVQYKDSPIAATHDSLAVLETASPPTYYLQEADINRNMLVEIPGKTSLCEWKGRSIYWALKQLPGHPVAWSYPNPYEEYQALKNYLAFYPQLLDCRVDGTKVRPQPGSFYAGWITPELVGPFKGEPGTGSW